MVATFERLLLAGLNCLWIIAFTALTVTFVCTGPTAVNGAPIAILDSKETTFPLELQPPLVDDDFSSKPSAIDSYGNPIDTLKPIETPDGRKVVSAQGLQFEIPTYASGITEIKKPADDLLPPFIDPVLNAEPEAVQTQAAKPFGQGNPFLAPYNNGAYNPQPKPFSKNSGKYNPPIATTTTTTTTSTTTTTTPAPVEKNPFDSATIPPWLSSFDYPDVGPGVPFSYDHDDPESAVFNDLLPPANLEAQATDSSKPVFVTTSPASFNNFNSPHNFPQHETQSSSTVPSSSSSAATTTTSLSSPYFPSKVTLPLPSINNNNQYQHQLVSRYQPTDTAAAQPPLVFIPPSTAEEATPSNDHSSVTSVNANPHAENAKNPSSSFNQNFPAPFEPETSAVPAQTPSSADQDAFPPFGGASSVPSKTTFTKSDEGKVITNNVFLNSAVGAPQQTSKPFTFGSPQKDFQASNNNQFLTPTGTGSGFRTSTYSTQNTGFTASSSTFNKPSTPASTYTTGAASFSSAASGFTKTSSASTTYAGAGKYTGGFGGAPGVLVAANIGQTGGPIRDPNQIYRASTPSSATVPIAAAPTALPRPIAHQSGSFAFGNAGGSFSSGTTVAQKYQSRFGGPPGILEPYDNVKNGRP